MTFTARLVRNHRIWTAWRKAHRIGGDVCGVRFRVVPGNDYVSDVLTADEVGRLRGAAGVTLEAFGGQETAPDALNVLSTVDWECHHDNSTVPPVVESMPLESIDWQGNPLPVEQAPAPRKMYPNEIRKKQEREEQRRRQGGG